MTLEQAKKYVLNNECKCDHINEFAQRMEDIRACLYCRAMEQCFTQDQKWVNGLRDPEVKYRAAIYK